MHAEIWNDARSGIVGCLVGDMVLHRLQKQEKTPIIREKGTVFTNDNRAFISRICTTEDYLQRGIIHFCNISKDQHKSVLKLKKNLTYLLITVDNHTVHYWLIPSIVMSKVLSKLNTKPDSTTCIIRIIERNNKHFIGDINISRYHHQLALNEAQISKITKARKKELVLN